MNVVAIVQARLRSTRLPGKVLEEISGQTMLERVVRRTSASTRCSRVVVATSDSPSDDVIERLCGQLGCDCARGSEHDVLERYHRAAAEFDADPVVRITSDCPLIDPTVIDRVIGAFEEQRPDYASNILERTYPRGLDTEVVSREALDRAWRDADQPYQREHVTPYIWQQPSLFRLLSVTDEEDHSHHRWTVDTAEDLLFVREVFARLADRELFSWRDVLAILEQEPKLTQINADVTQKPLTGPSKS